MSWTAARISGVKTGSRISTCIWRASSDPMPEGLRGGFPTHWTELGAGPRRALAIHCSLSHSGSWGPLAREVSGALRLTAFDLPGHGQSGAWSGADEIQAVSTAMAADFLDAPTDIIGHSFGATVALRLAVERPDLVRSLILYEPVFFAVGLHDQPGLRAGHVAEMAEYAAGMAVGDFLRAAEGFTGVWGDRRGWTALPEGARAAMAAQMPLIEAATAALYEDAGRMLSSGALERIGVPVLLMEGSASPEIIAAINAGLAARIPDARRVVVQGAGHMGPISHARVVAEEIRGFLGGMKED
ncbi:alpha/beta fold hydrolase [Roseovarius sp. 217]|uniref:alpha/beta fold hydrolase n=1 Tax=Roseovarius sp. (strain 217) TaxID=314264 RepID=UPI0020C816E1|nr:alpha/beta hydrolase [Roseovarius sp. 217]